MSAFHYVKSHRQRCYDLHQESERSASFAAIFESLRVEAAFEMGENRGRDVMRGPSRDWYEHRIVRAWHPGRLLCACLIEYYDPRKWWARQTDVFHDELWKAWVKDKSLPQGMRRWSAEWIAYAKPYSWDDYNQQPRLNWVQWEPGTANEKQAVENTKHRIKNHTRLAWEDVYRCYRSRDDLGQRKLGGPWHSLLFTALNWSPISREPDRLP